MIGQYKFLIHPKDGLKIEQELKEIVKKYDIWNPEKVEGLEEFIITFKNRKL